MARFFVGTSGFAYASWIGKFYPPSMSRDSFLSFYAQHFPAVEINSSFYHIPRLTTISKWVAQTPDDFCFSFKLSRLITHIHRLQADEALLAKCLKPLEPCTQKTQPTVILMQTPASLKQDAALLEALLKRLPASFRYAMEFRHPSWFQPAVYQLLTKFHVALVLADSPVLANGKRKWPLADVETTTFAYLRFHGAKVLFTSSYSEEELQGYARLVQEKLRKQMDVYAFFNNDAAGHAIDNARMLEQFVNRARTDH